MRSSKMKPAKIALATSAAILILAQPLLAAPGCLVPGVDDRCEAWVSTVDHPANGTYGYDAAMDSVLSPDGSRLYITGTTAASGGFNPNPDVLTVAINTASGAVVWKAVFDGDEANTDRPAALALSPDGSSLYVGATVNDTEGDSGAWNRDFAVIAYQAATGEQRWTRTYNGFELQGRDYGNNEVRDITVSPDGSVVYITGPSLAGATRWDYGTFAYDALTGDELWRARYDRGNGDDRSSFLVATEDRLYVVGYGDLGTDKVGQTDGNDDMIVLAYEASDPVRMGQQIYVARQDTGASDHPAKAAVTPDGERLLILKYVTGGYAVVSFDLVNGSYGWTKAKTAANGSLNATAITVSPTGDRFYVTGSRRGPGLVISQLDYSTTAFSLPDGVEAWSATYGLYEGSTEEEAQAVAVNPTGTRVYVTGYSSEPYYTYIPPVVTVAYDAANGTQKWVARHRRPTATLDHDRPVSAHVSPNGGRLYVGATFSYRPDPRYNQIATSDFAAIAYDTCEQVCPVETTR